jgi:hypothetical protein
MIWHDYLLAGHTESVAPRRGVGVLACGHQLTGQIDIESGCAVVQRVSTRVSELLAQQVLVLYYMPNVPRHGYIVEKPCRQDNPFVNVDCEEHLVFYLRFGHFPINRLIRCIEDRRHYVLGE